MLETSTPLMSTPLSEETPVSPAPDDGVTYGYERGAASGIPFLWDDASGMLTSGDREGTFPGMLVERTFAIVWVSRESPVGFTFAPPAACSVEYRGTEIRVRR